MSVRFGLTTDSRGINFDRFGRFGWLISGCVLIDSRLVLISFC